jgi:hypothetical protein
MSLLVADCPRCGAQQITFDVQNGIRTGVGHTDWLKRFEVFAVCRRCLHSTVFVLEIHRYEARDSFDKPEVFTKDAVSLNAALRVLGPITLKDRAQEGPPDYLPDEIKSAFEEGATCMAVRCWNAASTMFRLCLDLATRPLLPTPETSGGPQPNSRQRRDLGLRIPWLMEHGKLPADIGALAGAVREDGNDGAHAGSLGEVDAADLMDFTVLLLERLFTEPGRLAAAADRRAERRRA